MTSKEFFCFGERELILMGKAFAGLILSWPRKEYLLFLRGQIPLLLGKTLSI